jgi:hypothetical protein
MLDEPSSVEHHHSSGVFTARMDIHYEHADEARSEVALRHSDGWDRASQWPVTLGLLAELFAATSEQCPACERYADRIDELTRIMAIRFNEDGDKL